jgi:hypothetical protein
MFKFAEARWMLQLRVKFWYRSDSFVPALTGRSGSFVNGVAACLNMIGAQFYGSRHSYYSLARCDGGRENIAAVS